MNELNFSSVTMAGIFWLLGLLLVDYVAVLVAVVIDLRSGTLKARRNGVPRTSGGYRRTVDKLSRYFITLMALTVIDAMLVVSAMLLRSTMGWSVPVFPLFTTLGAVCLTLIEAKSVMENLQSKTDYTSAADAVAGLLADKSFRALIDALRDVIPKK